MSLGNRFSQHSFAQIPQTNAPRSRFDRSFAVKDTYDFDYLVPILVDEILPGDTVQMNVRHFTRLATQVVPVLDNMYLDFYFFFVPNRLVWTNWERFNGAQDNPGDSTDFLVPYLNIPEDGFPVGSLADKFGIPTDVEANITLAINSLPFRGYNLIWNEWFRDQNLQNSVDVPKGNGPDSPSDFVMLKAAKKHDYFTSALPWPQKGSAVSLPLGGTVPVVSNGLQIYLSTQQNTSYVDRSVELMPDTGVGVVGAGAAGGVAMFGTQTGLVGELDEATSVTVNALRQAFMMQSFLELDARGGTRYTEILKAHFNVISPDFRLQRPEFLASATTQITQHPIAQTSETAETPQANLAAFSTASEMGNRIGFSKSFVEHGYIFGLVRARADVTYQQGLNRMWSRRTRYEFFWPKFQELGEQAVLMQEIYLRSDALENEEVFGYQERFADYRYMPSQIRGQFRSTYAESLDVWHLAEEFGNAPALNATFIQSNTPIERSLAVTEGYPHLLADYWFDYKHTRPMTTYGVPATLGRF